MQTDVPIEERIAHVRERIAEAARRTGRAPEDITLLAVSKRKPAEDIARAYTAGLRNFGENYVQEAVDKILAVGALLQESGSITQPPALRWHFIGHLQRNKAREVAANFDCFHALDRIALARELETRAAALERTLDVLIQINLSKEPQKGGLDEGALPAFLDDLAEFKHLNPIGLMTIPAASTDPETNRPIYARLRELREALCALSGFREIRELSMGMSGDFEIAAEEGATILRVGTALFGPR